MKHAKKKHAEPLFGKVITSCLFIAFLATAGAGIALTYASASVEHTIQEGNKDAPPQGKSGNNETDIEIDIFGEKIKIRIKSAIPGLVVFTLGMAGLLLLLIKIPVRRILGYKQPSKGGFGLSLDFMTPMLSENAESIPLLMWLLIRNRGVAVRAEKHDNLR